jgi:hypothetical protein
MLKAESTIGIILVLIFGMSLGFFTSQTFINNYQNDLKTSQQDLNSLQKQHLQTLTENLELKEKYIEVTNKK